jgi:hypothetical protein
LEEKILVRIAFQRFDHLFDLLFVQLVNRKDSVLFLLILSFVVFYAEINLIHSWSLNSASLTGFSLFFGLLVLPLLNGCFGVTVFIINVHLVKSEVGFCFDSY